MIKEQSDNIKTLEEKLERAEEDAAKIRENQAQSRKESGNWSFAKVQSKITKEMDDGKPGRRRRGMVEIKSHFIMRQERAAKFKCPTESGRGRNGGSS